MKTRKKLFMFKLYSLDNKLIKISENLEPIPYDFTGIVEYKNGTKRWFWNGSLHRLDGPAVEYMDGTKRFYINDRMISVEQYKLFASITKLKGLMLSYNK